MDLPQRKANRLKTYDYSSAGAYFVTVCTKLRRNTLSTIDENGRLVLKFPGIIAEQFVRRISEYYTNVIIDRYVIMPNHIHLLLRFEKNVPDAQGPTLGTVMGWYKYNVTKQINAECNNSGIQFFQRSFHDHVIRGEKDYLKIWEYIENNPARWKEDCFYISD